MRTVSHHRVVRLIVRWKVWLMVRQVGTEYAAVVSRTSFAQQYPYIEGQRNLHEKFQRHKVRPATFDSKPCMSIL